MSGRENVFEPMDEAVTPAPGPVAPPSFGQAGPQPQEDHPKPSFAVPLFGPDKPWWAASPEEETRAEPAEPAEPAATTTGPRKASQDVLVAGHGAPGIDTRGAVPQHRGDPSSGLNDTDPDGIPRYPTAEEEAPQSTSAAPPEAGPVAEPALMPDAVLPPGVPPGAHLLVADDRAATGVPVTVGLVPGPVLRPAEQSGPGTGPMPTVGSVASGMQPVAAPPPPDRAVAEHNRRALAIGGLVAAAILIPATVFAIVGATSGSSPDEDARPRSAKSDNAAAPQPTDKPAVRSPVDINSEKTDTRPLTLQEVYGALEMGLGPRYFLQDRTSVNHQCELTANGVMAQALENGKCRSVVRATYINVRKTLAVTAGIAVMPTHKAAAKADKAGDPSAYEWFRGLPGKRSPGIDQGGGYASSTVRGRYIIYAYATHLEGAATREDDAVLKEVAEQFLAFSARPIDQRATGRS